MNATLKRISTLKKICFGLSAALAIGLAVAACFEALAAKRDTNYIRDVFIAETFAEADRQLAKVAAPTESNILEARLQALALATARLAGFETTIHAGRSGPYKLLKAPPAETAQIGGQCGNLTRLFTTAARLAGLEARRAHLYEIKGINRPLPEAYVHAVVEVKVEDRWRIVDPLYGVVYRNAAGQLAESSDLAANPELVRNQVSNRLLPTDHMHFPPAPYNFDLYHFAELRRIRWTILPGGEAIRSLVAKVVGEEAANAIAYPSSFERPHQFLAVTYGLSSLAFGGFAALLWRRFSRD